MNHSRHHAREVALQILYRYDVLQQQSQAQIQAQQLAEETKPAAPSGLALAEELRKHFDHFQVAPGVREFAAELVAGTLARGADIDVELEKYAINWKVNRMALIDRNLLRMSYYELTQMNDIPDSVTIDEAVELAKQFGTAETSSFVNAILDNIRKAKPA